MFVLDVQVLVMKAQSCSGTVRVSGLFFCAVLFLSDLSKG